MAATISLFWFRRDLRLNDNAGLYHALCSGHPVLPVFIFDKNILDDLEEKADRRVQFIHDSLTNMQNLLTGMGSSLYALYDDPLNAFKKIGTLFKISAVYTNHDYEPYAQKRDADISSFLREQGIGFHTFKDQVIFEKNEVVKADGSPYTVYTPYSRKWKEKLNESFLMQFPSEKYGDNFYKTKPLPLPSLKDMGFIITAYNYSPAGIDKDIARTYDKTRDFMALQQGTTMLGVHLRFGTVSIRQMAAEAHALNATLLNELIWREFYQMILWHFPHVVAQSFRPEYDQIKWRNNEREFALWCAGETGYAIVDAGMRQLNETGYMHNRVRMITAGFLVKHLLVDWRWGEAYFAQKLLDYDLAANNGGWQWAAGSGCDAVPYFRIFNPYLQTERFDPEHTYIRRWLPEYDKNYIQPIVDHKVARQRCIDVYKQGLKKQ